MGRVAHQKSAQQTATSNSVRGPKAAKQRKNHRVVIESDSLDKDKSRAVLHFRADPPPGYTFIPAGNPQLTSALKEFAKKGSHQILAVTTTPHASRHELSREVHRIGFHFPTEVVAQVCNHYGIRLTSGGKLVEEKDDDKLFMRLYQRGQLALDEKVRDQVTINTEAKQIIQDLFPKIPDNDLFQIIKTAFQLGDNKVGTADEIPLVRRAQLSVVAHIRHTYTSYDKLLRAVPYSEARHKVENITLQKLIDWRGDGSEDKQAMDDTLREVVVISDEEDSDEVEDGRLLHHDELSVQPVRAEGRSYNAADGQPQAPIEVESEDEHARGYRYVPQVERRYAVQDPIAWSTARQQSRYAVWDRVRQEYRNELDAQPARVVERVLIDEPSVSSSQATYVTREPVYAPEPLQRRLVEPNVRIAQQPSPATYVRGTDGKLYERIAMMPEHTVASQQAYTPPPKGYVPQYQSSRQTSPRPQAKRNHSRADSFENHDGTIMPSIESSNSVVASPATRHNPFDFPRPAPRHQNPGAYESNQRHVPLIDLTDSAEKASKRRRLEEEPPSPYLKRYPERSQNELERNEGRSNTRYPNDENAHPPHQQHLIPLENPATVFEPRRAYRMTEARTQPTVLYREEIVTRDMPSPRGAVGAAARYVPSVPLAKEHYPQSPQRIEYVKDYQQDHMRVYRAPMQRNISGHAMKSTGDGANDVALEDLSIYDRPVSYRAEPTTIHVRPGEHGTVEYPTTSQHYVKALPYVQDRREYAPSRALHYISQPRDVQVNQQSADHDNYYQPRILLAPEGSAYRDGQVVRPTHRPS